ncbi:MAG: FtsX-like permease family protein [Sediminibacterium sp.]|nr:FtsX-like permease family protein [Sediminibacterium sp.]
MGALLLCNIALNIMRSRLKQTIVAACGVCFGITLFVTLLSFMRGLDTLLDSLITNRTPHINLKIEQTKSLVQPIEKVSSYQNSIHFISTIRPNWQRTSIYNAPKILQNLDQDVKVLGYSRWLGAQVFFSSGAVKLGGLINGIDVDKEIDLYNFREYICAGKAEELNIINNGILLGKPLAEKLGLNLGDQVHILTDEGTSFDLKLIGLYQTGLSDFDKTQSFTSIKVAQNILQKPADYINEIHVKLKHIDDAPHLTPYYASIFDLYAQSIQKANAQFETGAKIRKTIAFAVGITLLIVAGFGIYNILNMMIYEKMDTIAILKSMGFSGNDVKKIFMFISLSIGVAGCLIGSILARLFTFLIHLIPFKTEALPNVKTMPVLVLPEFFVIALLFSLVTTFFAGWFPAHKASKIDPVEIIRGK